MTPSCFAKPPGSLQEILKLMTRTASGREALERFLPLVESGKIDIQPYPMELLTRLRAALGPDQPIGACLINDFSHGTIYLDLQSPIGILAPFLFHEMIHALDPAIWRAASARSENRVAPEDPIFLQTELRAFDAQRKFVEELSAREPAYGDFLASQSSRIKKLTDRLTENDIAGLYGFDRVS